MPIEKQLNMNYSIALNLIQTRIKGTCKVSDAPTWTHSQNVFEILTRYGFAEKVCLAVMLHDVIEDSDGKKYETDCADTEGIFSQRKNLLKN